jgi:hypothetical protein
MGGLMQLVAYGAQDCYLGGGRGYSYHIDYSYPKPELGNRLYMNFDINLDKDTDNKCVLTEMLNELVKIEKIAFDIKPILNKIQIKKEREKSKSINSEDKGISAHNKLVTIRQREKKEKKIFANNHMRNQMKVQMRRR